MKRATRLAFAAACMFAAAAAIADLPSAFTLTATPICSSAHPAILLQWTTSGGAASYDVTRDSVPLVQGLSSDATSFEDSSNDVGSTHSYVITAIDKVEHRQRRRAAVSLHAAAGAADAQRQCFVRCQYNAEAPIRKPVVECVGRRDLL